jgi:hypothetical protein
MMGMPPARSIVSGTALLDEEAAVGVSVEGDADVGAGLAGLPHDELAVLGEEGVRLVVGEAPVGLEEATHDVELREVLEHRGEHHARHAVRRVDDDAQRSNGLSIDEGEHLLDEARQDVFLPKRAARP